MSYDLLNDIRIISKRLHLFVMSHRYDDYIVEKSNLIKHFKYSYEFIRGESKAIKSKDVDFTQIYPKDIRNLFIRKYVENILSWFDYVGYKNRGDEVEEDEVMILFILMVCQVIMYMLIVPVLRISADNMWEDVDLDYEVFGYDKSDINNIKIINNIVKKDVKKIVNSDIKDKDLEQVKKYLRMLSKFV